MSNIDINNARRLAYKYLKEFIVKGESDDGKREFAKDHMLAMNFLLEQGGTSQASPEAGKAALVLETALHIEASIETGSAFKIPLGENETLLVILNRELEERVATLEALIRQSVASRAGKARAAKNPASIALKEIEKHYEAKKKIFKIRGHAAEFARQMQARYPEITCLESINRLVTRLNKTNELIPPKK